MAITKRGRDSEASLYNPKSGGFGASPVRDCGSYVNSVRYKVDVNKRVYSCYKRTLSLNHATPPEETVERTNEHSNEPASTCRSDAQNKVSMKDDNANEADDMHREVCRL